MNLYCRNLKRIGIGMMAVGVGNTVYELLIRQYLTGRGSAYAISLPLPWAICAKGLLGAAAGLTALYFYRTKRRYTLGTLILFSICAATMAVIMAGTEGPVGKRTNGLFDITVLIMILLTYTLSQADRDVKHWNIARGRPTAALDLRLVKSEDFFDPVQIGPKMAISRTYAEAIRRYVASMHPPASLHINLFCAEPVSEVTRDMMREALVMHCEEEESRIVKTLESRYRRILRLAALSVSIIAVIRQTSLLSDELIVWEIIGNFAAFGLWQIGYTHYERTEAYDELLIVHIARNAGISFIER